jgi:parallel beta-helix repeat protein
MTDDRSKALVPQGPTSLSPLSRLAERTLAERVEREERALVSARTLVVGPGGYATITQAIDAARDGDTVLVKPGRYEESVVVEGKTITIQGDGDRDGIVVGWDHGPAFTLVATRSTLVGLTIVGGRPRPATEVLASLQVTGGAPQLDGLRVTHGRGIVFRGTAAGVITRSQIDSNDNGIWLHDAASPRIEENDIWANKVCGIYVGGTGSDSLIRANRIHDCQSAGISVWEGASPRVEENDIWANRGGIYVRGAGTDPLVRANRVHDAILGSGISVWEGASPRVEENDIWANRLPGISIRDAGTDPLVRANRVHDGHDRGIGVAEGASPRIEGNEVWANRSAGIWISGAGTSPVIIGNTVRDGFADGISVLESASPTIAGNTITGNAFEAIRVGGDAVPKIGPNVVMAASKRPTEQRT